MTSEPPGTAIARAAGDEANARGLRHGHPGWIVLWLARTSQYRAYEGVLGVPGHRADRRHAR
jgi:hypothetical protein